jgi:hypothetical protein
LSSASNAEASVNTGGTLTRSKALIQGMMADMSNPNGIFNQVNYPKFVQMGNALTATLPNNNGDFRPTATSVLVDAGDNSAYDTSANGIFDLFGGVRIKNSIINIGAYE